MGTNPVARPVRFSLKPWTRLEIMPDLLDLSKNAKPTMLVTDLTRVFDPNSENFLADFGTIRQAFNEVSRPRVV